MSTWKETKQTLTIGQRLAIYAVLASVAAIFGSLAVATIVALWRVIL